MKDTEIKDLIPKDVSRCSDKSCPINYLCKRYQQRFIDTKKGEKQVPVTDFEGAYSRTLCKWFLNIEK